MILWRVFPHDPKASDDAAGGALHWPRWHQGAGRHDNPDRYACLYLAEEEVSAVAEALAPFRGTGDLRPGMLRRGGRPLATARLALDDSSVLVDLDEPSVLATERLRPSRVATRTRAITQGYAAELFDGHPEAVGLRWWSSLESLWTNVTLFDRAGAALSVEGVHELEVADEVVRATADLLGLGT